MSGASSGLFSFAILPDIHCHPSIDPDESTQDDRALSVVEQILATQRLDACVQVGDFVDHEGIGRFSRDQPKKLVATLESEWAIARNVRARLARASRAKFARCRYYGLEGNHEKRLGAFEGLHPQLAGLFDLPKQLGITDDGLARWVPTDSTGQLLRFVWPKDRPGCIVPRIVKPDEFDPYPEPGATIGHGWSHGQNADKQTADMSPYPGPIFMGHSHRLQQKHAKRFGVGNAPTAYILGTLGRLTPPYVSGKPTGWQQSFGICHMSLRDPMIYQVVIIGITDGKAIGPDGRMYRSKV